MAMTVVYGSWHKWLQFWEVMTSITLDTSFKFSSIAFWNQHNRSAPHDHRTQAHHQDSLPQTCSTAHANARTCHPIVSCIIAMNKYWKVPTPIWQFGMMEDNSLLLKCFNFEDSRASTLLDVPNSMSWTEMVHLSLTMHWMHPCTMMCLPSEMFWSDADERPGSKRP